ncbi:phosphatase PAP2 family protein [Methylorubrum populi]|nr:phosphatase PAP2 family protein [Methylorubrum populi]
MLELRKDLPLHVLTFLYFLAAAAISLMVGAVDRFAPTVYFSLWMKSAALCLLIYLLVFEVPISVVGRSRRPLSDAIIRLWGRIKLRALPLLALLINLSIFYSVFTSVKNMLPIFAPEWRDLDIANFSQLLHFGYVPWRLLQEIMGYPTVTRFVEFLYLPVWLLLLVGLPVLLAVRRDLARLRVRYILTMFLCFIMLGNIVAALGMSGGPAFYAQITGDQVRYGELIDYLAFSSGLPFSAWDIQRYLWACFEADRLQLGSGISAFPSLHVSMATLFALAGRHLSLRLGRLLMLYCVAIFLGSVHLGWHYAVDGYASVLGTVVLWLLAGRVMRRSDSSKAAPAEELPRIGQDISVGSAPSATRS